MEDPKNELLEYLFVTALALLATLILLTQFMKNGII